MTQIPEQGGSEVIIPQLRWPRTVSGSQGGKQGVAPWFAQPAVIFRPPPTRQLSAINFIFTVTHNRTSCFHLFPFFFGVGGCAADVFIFFLYGWHTDRDGGRFGWRVGEGEAKIDVGGCCYDVVSFSIPQSTASPTRSPATNFLFLRTECTLDEAQKAVEASET